MIRLRMRCPPFAGDERRDAAAIFPHQAIVAANFRRMLIFSACFGLLGAASGVFSSYYLDAPTGPTIVLADVGILTLCLVFARLVRGRRKQAAAITTQSETA